MELLSAPPCPSLLCRRLATCLAEAVRFELTNSFPSLVFKTSAFNHSATLPVDPALPSHPRLAAHSFFLEPNSCKPLGSSCPAVPGCRLATCLAEAVRFELTNGFPSLVFKTSAFNHSATLPVDPAFPSHSRFASGHLSMAGAEGLEPPTYGFGDRHSAN